MKFQMIELEPYVYGLQGLDNGYAQIIGGTINLDKALEYD